MPGLNEEVFLVAPLRTPIGRFGGSLSLECPDTL